MRKAIFKILFPRVCTDYESQIFELKSAVLSWQDKWKEEAEANAKLKKSNLNLLDSLLKAKKGKLKNAD